MRKTAVLAWLLLALILPTALGEGISCREHRPACRLLQTVMQGAFDDYDPDDLVEGRVYSAACDLLRSITDEDIEHYGGEFDVDESAVRGRWYAALANALWAEIRTEATPGGGPDSARRVLLLFLDGSGEADAEAEKAQIRSAMTDEVITRISIAADVPEGFVRWLVYDKA